MNTEKFFNLASVFASNLASGSIPDQNKTSITVCILIEDMKWFHDFRDYYPHSLVSLLSNSPPSVAASEEEEIQQNLKKEFGAKETPLDLEISESDKTFLEEAHRDYLRFLALQKKYNFTRGPESEEGAGKICATYKIDLFWHSHVSNLSSFIFSSFIFSSLIETFFDRPISSSLSKPPTFSSFLSFIII